MDNSGMKLKTRREKLNLSLRELSQITGISKATLSRYENNGLVNVSMDKLLVIAEKLNTTVEYLIDGSSLTNNQIEEAIYFYSEASKNPKSNFRHYFDSLDDYLDAVDELDRKKNDLVNLIEKVIITNEDGMLIIKEFVNYIMSKDKYIDKHIQSYFKMEEHFQKDLKKK